MNQLKDVKHRMYLPRILVFLSCLLFIFINVKRILEVPMTHDESPSQGDLLLTYADYIQLTKVTANIHILNSILRKFFIETFSNTPFFLRLPTLLGHIAFLYFSWRLTDRVFKNKWWALAVFLALSLNPFLFEFWGLSRGYGLAIAMMTISIYYFVCYTDDQKIRYLAASLLFAILSIYSNFTLLNYFIGLSAFLFLYGLLLRGTIMSMFLKRDLPVWLGAVVVLYLLVATPIRKLVASGELYYGGDRNLFEDTIRSLVKESMYEGDSEIAWNVACVVSGMIIVALIYWLVLLLQKKYHRDTRHGLFFCCLLFIALLSLVLQHELLGTKYLIDRTALFLYVLFVLVLMTSLYRFRKIKVPAVLAFVLIVLSIDNFYKHITFTNSRLWWGDNYNTEVLSRILKNSNTHTGHKIRLRVNWTFMPSLNYYIFTRYADRFEPLIYTKDPPQASDTTYDYMYLTLSDREHVPDIYVVDTAFCYEVFQLWKRK